MPNFMQASGGGTNGQAGSAAAAQTTDEAIAKINRELKEKAVAERAKERGIQYVDLSLAPINPDILPLVSDEEAEKAVAMPFSMIGKRVRIAVNNPESPEVATLVQNLQARGYEVEIALASDISIVSAQKLYRTARFKPEVPEKIEVGKEKKFERELETLAGLKDKLEVLPAQQAIDTLHGSAIKAGASDIHYQPEEKFCTVRFRIDGVLHKVFDISPSIYAQIANQLKFESKMKLNIFNVPQDGRFSFAVEDRTIDVRISTLPTEYGESIVCRILDSGKKFMSFEELGFMWKSLDILKKAASISYGMVLCAGPTGSGKTTTLYAMLRQMNRTEAKIVTLEDPIEYHLPGVMQSQINEKRDYTFSEGLKAVLRQDPNVIMIGEIRDLPTASASAQAALTGHVLLSTLHTNSAVESVARLLSIGVKPFVIAPALHTVVAQRLVRRICGKCATEREITKEERKVFEETLETAKRLDPATQFSVAEKLKLGKGCAECNMTGFRGQMVLSEVFIVNDEVETAVLNGAPKNALFDLARKQGMLTLQEDGVLKAMLGYTTLDEVYRVTTIAE